MEKSELIKHADTAGLAPQDIRLLEQARENMHLAYAPYSGFRVGAAVRTGQGSVAGGANQENASYPLCMCGERVALYHCAVRYPGEEIETVAIAVKGKKPLASPAPPCGACLQVIREFETRQNDKPIRLLLMADGNEVWEVPTVRILMPFSFDGSFL